MTATTTKPLTKKAAKEAERAVSLMYLRAWIKPGDRIYTILRHVSSSGMSRRISLVLVVKGEPRYLDFHVGRVLDYKRPERGDGLQVGGCGMDMGYHLVHNLGYALFSEPAMADNAKGRKLREALLKADRHYYTQGGKTAPDPSKPDEQFKHGAGYALKHSWL